MYILSGMNVTVSRSELLAIVTKNREEHSEIVAEARKVYVGKAREALAKRLDDLERGKTIHLLFSLQAPVDQTTVYNTAIKMIEMHKLDTIELSSEQVRCLVQDQWDWTKSFYATNSTYSEKAASKLDWANNG
jgi:hypothetical protein